MADAKVNEDMINILLPVIVYNGRREAVLAYDTREEEDGPFAYLLTASGEEIKMALRDYQKHAVITQFMEVKQNPTTFPPPTRMMAGG